MKPKDAFGRYGCVPREMHPAWQRVSYFARALGRDLISRVDDFDTMRIETSGEWRTSLCLTLSINGPERRNAKAALDSLASAGLLQAFDGFVVIGLQPVCSRSVSVPDPDLSQVTEKTQVTFSSKQAIKQASESDARARESSARFEKPPVGEAPPNTPPSAPSLPSWLVAWPIVERTTDKAGMLGHPGRHQEWLQQLAAAAEREQACHLASSFPEAVERLVRAWMADPWVIKNDADVGNIGVWLRRRKAPKPKPIVKLVPELMKASDCYSDADLLAWPAWREGDLDIWQKQRRWELQARAERKAGAAE